MTSDSSRAATEKFNEHLASENERLNKEVAELRALLGRPITIQAPEENTLRQVTAEFKETQLKYMRPGQSASIHVDTFGRDYEGTVENLPGAAGTLFSLLPPENASGNFVKVVQRLPVRIRFNPNQDPQHLLRPGMSVEPKVKVH